MVIKKMARKDRDFGQLMDYIKKGSFEPGIFYNLAGADHGKVLEQFEENSKLVKHRKNGNYFYHEILSFSPADSGKLNFSILEDLTMKYLDLRTKGRGLAYAGVHWEKNPHVHIMLSANELGNSKKLDLSKAEFVRLRRNIETYQRTKYPFLEKSLVFNSRGRVIQKTRGEGELGRRLKRAVQTAQTQKERACEVFKQCLNRAESLGELKRFLTGEGFEFYQRGQTLGVRDLESGRKYRLKTLGVLMSFKRSLRKWERVKRRTKEVEKLREIKKTTGLPLTRANLQI